MNYYTHIIDGQLKVGTEKPEWKNYIVGEVHDVTALEQQQALKDWEESLMDVDGITGYGKLNEGFGIEYIERADTFDIKTYDPGEGDYKYREIRIGQQVEIEKTGKGCVITKLI